MQRKSNIHRPKSLISLGCLHPIKAPEGSAISYYPCGHCQACLLAKSNAHTQALNFELMYNGQYPIFALLTYSNNNLPVVEVHYDYLFKKDYQITVFDTETGEELTSMILHENELKKTIHHANKKHLTDRLRFTPSASGSFLTSTLRYTDVQKFLKRLRRYNEKKGLPCIRYCYCGEYGPTTARPHYHLLLFCESALQRALLAKYIMSNWEYGFANSKYFNGSNGKYISQYINSSDDVSTLFFRMRTIRPRFFHSVRLGRKGFARLFGSVCEIYSDRRAFFQPVSKVVDGNVQDIYPSLHYLSSVCSKCLRFDLIDHRLRVKYYSVAFRFIESIANTPSEVAHILLNDMILYGKLLSLREAPGYVRDLISLVLYDIHEDSYLDTEYTRKMIYDRLYRMCRISFQTYNNIRAIYKVDNPITCINEYVDFVEQLYNDVDYYRLTQQLQKLEAATKDYSFDEVAYFLYDNYEGELSIREDDDKYSTYNVSRIKLYNHYCNYLNMLSNERSKSKKIKDLITSKCSFYGTKRYVPRKNQKSCFQERF